MSALMIATLALYTLPAQVGKIYRCTNAAGTVAYQSTPCPSNQSGGEIKPRNSKPPTEGTVPPPGAVKEGEVAAQPAPSLTTPTDDKAHRTMMPIVPERCLASMADVKREFDRRFATINTEMSELEAEWQANQSSWEQSKSSKVGEVWQRQLLEQRTRIEERLRADKDAKERMYGEETERYKLAKSNCPKS